MRWLYFFLGLAGAWLFYTGNLLWVETRRKKQRRDNPPPSQRRDTRIMAALTVGVCLGSISGISLSIAAAKWLHGHVDDLNNWHMMVYYLVFFAAIGWAFVRGPARAAVDLLWLAAAATLLIPLTSLFAGLMPDLNLWVHLSGASVGVDITAVFGTVVFALMAKAARRRVYGGIPRDSIWSAGA